MKRDIDVSNRNIGKYRIGNKLGQGNWATVYEAFSLDGMNKYAVKVTTQAKLKAVPKLRQLVQAEIQILKTCNNPNVIKFIDQFKDNENQFIVMQFCNGGQLAEQLRSKEALIESKAVEYLKQILNGFKGLHQVKAIHRDFKVENVLLHNNICKISDLGFGKMLIQEDVTRTKLGSNMTMAPQVMENKPYGIKADIWSVGVVFYQLIYGVFPFKSQTIYGILQMAKSGEIDFSNKNITNQAEDFIRKCLNYNPDKRISWLQIYEHPLIADRRRSIFLSVIGNQISFIDNAKFYKKSQIMLDKAIEINRAIKKESQEKWKPDYPQIRQLEGIQVKPKLVEIQKSPNIRPKSSILLDQDQQFQQQQPIVIPSQSSPKHNEQKFKMAQFQQRRKLIQNKQILFSLMQKKYKYQSVNVTFLSFFIYYHSQNYSRCIKNIDHLYIYLIFKDAYRQLNGILCSIIKQYNIFDFKQQFCNFIKNKKTELIQFYKQRMEKILETMIEYRKHLINQIFNKNLMQQILCNDVLSPNWTNIYLQQLNNFWIQLGNQLQSQTKIQQNVEYSLIYSIFILRFYLNNYKQFTGSKIQFIIANFEKKRGKEQIISAVRKIRQKCLTNNQFRNNPKISFTYSESQFERIKRQNDRKIKLFQNSKQFWSFPRTLCRGLKNILW